MCDAGAGDGEEFGGGEGDGGGLESGEEECGFEFEFGEVGLGIRWRCGEDFAEVGGELGAGFGREGAVDLGERVLAGAVEEGGMDGGMEGDDGLRSGEGAEDGDGDGAFIGGGAGEEEGLAGGDAEGGEDGVRDGGGEWILGGVGDGVGGGGVIAFDLGVFEESPEDHVPEAFEGAIF